MKDALNNPIIIGQLYGYSQNRNGFTYVRVGIADHFTETRVTLLLKSSSTALYEGELKPEINFKNKISVKSNMLFPVYEKEGA